jgi:hypothetical protein
MLEKIQLVLNNESLLNNKNNKIFSILIKILSI